MDTHQSREIPEQLRSVLLSLVIVFAQYVFIVHEQEHLAESDHAGERCDVCLGAGSVKHTSSTVAAAFMFAPFFFIPLIEQSIFLGTSERYYTVLPREPPTISVV